MELIWAARRSGARLVLFGRKIRLAEDPLFIVELMRRIADDGLGPVEAVKIYHDRLKKAGVAPIRSLKKDLEITDPVLKACASSS